MRNHNRCAKVDSRNDAGPCSLPRIFSFSFVQETKKFSDWKLPFDFSANTYLSYFLDTPTNQHIHVLNDGVSNPL